MDEGWGSRLVLRRSSGGPGWLWWLCGAILRRGRGRGGGGWRGSGGRSGGVEWTLFVFCRFVWVCFFCVVFVWFVWLVVVVVGIIERCEERSV